MGDDLVGRGDERAAVLAFLAREHDGPQGLVLEGPAGIGKSALLHAALAGVRDRGSLVLSTRATEAEQGLVHVGLIDLLEDAIDSALEPLAPPRRRALQSVLLLADPPPAPIDPRALALGLRDALQHLAARGPVLLTVDDVQWLDGPSYEVLSFALRRLHGGPVRVITAHRTGTPLPAGDEVPFLLPETEILEVGPLSVGALHQLLRDRLSRPFARQTLLRLHESSGGNPLLALELARDLDPDSDPLRELPAPRAWESLVRARFATLPPDTREALALVAALGAPRFSLLERSGVQEEVLHPAYAARLLVREDGVVRFAHPLLASAVYQDLGARRLALHSRLADVVTDPLTRARHLALSRDEPDEAVAAELARAAELATARGAAGVGAELLEHALRLTPAEATASRQDRALATARAQLAAGEWTRARAVLDALLDEAHTGPVRAAALLQRAELEHDDLAVPVLEQALREASEDPALRASIALRHAWARRFRVGFAQTLADIRAVTAQGDLLAPALRVEALILQVVLGRLVGDPSTADDVEEAHRSAARTGDRTLLREVDQLRPGHATAPRDVDAHREALERLLQEWEGQDELFASSVLWDLAWVELWAGRWALAAEHAARSREIGTQYGVDRNQDHIPLAWIAVHRGELERALQESERGLELCVTQIGFRPPLLEAVPGLVALCRQDATTAVAHLERADATARTLAWRAAGARPWTFDYVEALVEAGRPDEAAAVAQAWERDALRLGDERVQGRVLACRGLVLAGRADLEQAESVLRRAVARLDELGDAFGRARTQLVLGGVLRRGLRKSAAREVLEAAAVTFAQLGAPVWLARARQELGSIGGRTRESGLTTAERRVAVLAAEGRTNREVAAELFLGERTVAGHLTRVYAKLGVRSRTELARRLR